MMTRSWLLLLLALGLCLGAGLARGDTPDLLARSSVGELRLNPGASDRNWLRQRQVLWLGVSGPDRPPWDITATGRDYEGLTADYAGLLGELLDIPIRVRRYASRDQAIAALHTGDIDLLGTVSSDEAARAALLLSHPSADTPPGRPRRAGAAAAGPPRRPGVRLALREGYMSEAHARQLFPDARLIFVPSLLNAMGAVALGQADVFIGDAVGAHHLSRMHQLAHLKLEPTALFEGGHYGFAVTTGNLRLKALLDGALKQVPASVIQEIQRRWGRAGGFGAAPPLDLSVQEREWLGRHPRVKVAADQQFLPVSYRDEHGDFRGISADLLEQISQRTGLLFDIVEAGTFNQTVEDLAAHRVDMVAALPFSAWRQERVRFSRAWLSNSLVLVTQQSDETLDSLDNMAGKRLALVQGSVLTEYILEHHPHIDILWSHGPQDALERVASGEARGAVVSLIGAHYNIARRWRGELSIRAALPVPEVHFAFATRCDAPELQSILNKALQSIAPRDMAELTGHWRSEVIVAESYWSRYLGLILQGGGVALVMLLMAMYWIRSLREQVARRQEAERALEDQLEFMRAMIDGTPHPLYVRDLTGRLLTCNTSFLEALRVTKDAVVGKRMPEWLVGTDQVRLFREAFRRVLEHGTAIVEDREVVLCGKRLTLYHWMLPYRTGDGSMAGLIGGWVDVSERRELCDALRIAKEEAEAANQAKTTFLTTMSHEIRTPMNALLGMLELALRKAEKGQLDRLAIEVASSSARGLLDLVGDILDITRIESGHLELTPQPVELCSEVESAVRLFEAQARKKQLRLTLDMDNLRPVQVLLDPVRFKQVLANLLSNAIKFTQDGEVCVSLALDVHPGRVGVMLSVEDTGVGIPAEDLDGLGQPFRQASNNHQSARSGSGLGLSINHTLCEMMGGDMRLDSTLGAGTRARVRLDLPRVAVTGIALDREPALPTRIDPPLDILVVDDYPANRLLLQQQLSYLGHRVTLAGNGHEGLRTWLRQRFDVLITDCNMPGLNGYAFARAVREDERRKHKDAVLLLGCTANARPEERQRCRDAGMDDCLFKPLNLKELADKLAPERREAKPRETVQVEPVEGLDLSALRQLTGGDLDAVKRLLGDLLDSNRDDLQRLICLHHSADFGGLADLAHRVKGGARIIKARWLLQACDALEQACNGRVPPTRFDSRVDDLRQAMTALTQRLEKYCES